MGATGSPDTAVRLPAAYRYGDSLPATSLLLAELLKDTELQELFESYYTLIKIPIAIIDLNANVLISSRWQRICTQFHRVNPTTCARCVECDTKMAVRLAAGQTYTIYPCLNGLTDCASPIIIEERHIANLFIGQFLTAEPDEARFRRQAEEFAFDVGDYLAALHEVPIVEEDRIPHILDMLARMTRVITRLSIERKRAIEERARQSLILDTIPQSVFWKDREGRYLGCNVAFARAAGLAAPADVAGKTDFDMPWPRSEAEAYRADDRAVIEENRPRLRIAESLQQADGSRLSIETSKVPLADLSGEPRGVVGIYDDVTERREAERKVEESVARLRAAFMTGADAYVIVGQDDGLILEANQQFLTLYGYERGEVIGRTSLELEMWADPDERRRLLERLGTDGHVRNFEVLARRKNGATFPVLYSITRLSGEGPPLIMGVIRDVTEERRSAEALRKMEEQFRQAQRLEAVGRLAGGVAHDFNNILMAIGGYTDLLLLNFPANDPRRAELEEIKAAAQRATALTRQLLAFSRKQVLQPRVLDLNQVIDGLEKMLRRLIGEDVTLGVSPGDGLHSVRADPGQIEQVILNLAVNARDAMPGGGRLTIETANVELDETHARAHPGAAVGRYVMLAVSDTGTGMDPETRSHIFEPFFTTKEQGKGTGLGLATVHGIVNQSGGHIEVYSEPGHGTAFKIYLPRVEQAAESLDVIPPRPPVDARGETVLVAEDDRAVRDVVARALEQRGYRVLAAPDGVSALELARSHGGPVDLLLTDLVMPGMTGRELAQSLAAAQPGMRVIYMSGYTDDAVVRHGVLEQGLPFIQKPCTAEALAVKVREVLDRKT